mmetsp:Transcript_35609/g.83255  ORF Transcript_35609/g.83255 Transcript_35609/m.83255 type:complete len:1065 (-) Transcript_35609:96-3290(-)
MDSDSSDGFSDPGGNAAQKGLHRNQNGELESHFPVEAVRTGLQPPVPTWPQPRRWGPGGSPWRLRRLNGTNCEARKPLLTPKAKPPQVEASSTSPTFSFTPTVPVAPAQPKAKTKKWPAAASRNLDSVRSIVHMKGCTALVGAPEVEELARVIRRELSLCSCWREVKHAAVIAAKVINAPPCEMLSLSGRVACRLREAMEAVRSGSTFSMLDVTQRRVLEKVLSLEVRKRQAELAGWEEEEAEVLAVNMNHEDLEKACKQQNAAGSRKSWRRTAAASARSTGGGLRERIDNPHPQEAPSASETVLPAVVPHRKKSYRRPPTASDAGTVSGHADRLPPVHQMSSHLQGSLTQGKSPLVEAAEESNAAQNQRRNSRGEEAPSSDLDVGPLTRIFNKLQDDGKVHHDDIALALEMVGFRYPEQAWVNDVFKEVTKYSGCDLGEFIRIVRAYDERQHLAFKQAFTEVDEDESGTVSVGELGKLLSRFGMTPMEHVLNEIIDEVDDSGDGTLNLAEFETAMTLLRHREGFTKREYDEFMAIYTRFDADASGEINAQELYGILVYLGFMATEKFVEETIDEFDMTGNGSIEQCHFLSCMRKVREVEVDEIAAVMKRSDADNSGTLDVQELQEVLRCLEYLPDIDTIHEVVREIGFDPTTAELNLSQVWQFLVLYRKREGLSSAEVQDVRDVFDAIAAKHPQPGRGESYVEISTLKVGQALAWLGGSIPFEVHQTLVSKVDVDATGNLSFDEVCKLVRLLQAREVFGLREVFLRHASDIGAAVSLETAEKVLRESGCVDSSGGVPQVAAEDCITSLSGGRRVEFHGVVRTMTRFKRQARRLTRENWGFSAQEVLELEIAFSRYKNDSDAVDGHRLTALIEERFPIMSGRADMRPILREAILEADSDGKEGSGGKGRLNYKEFLRLMDHLRQLNMEERLRRERAAVQDTKFALREVEEFRELFVLAEPSTNDFITAHSFQVMLGRVCPLGDKNSQELAGICKRVTGRPFQGQRENSNASLDFPEFLRVVNALLEKDFAQISERSLRMQQSGARQHGQGHYGSSGRRRSFRLS